jgi:hypothetical protein
MGLTGITDTFRSIERFSTYTSKNNFDTMYETGDISMSTKKRVAAVLITTVAISAGTVSFASASSTQSNSRHSITKVSNMGVKGDRVADLKAILAGLVASGTITQIQADAILKTAETMRAAAKAALPAKPDRTTRLALIASTIGIDTATVQARLAAGETLSVIAGAKKDALIAALVADETKRIDAAVTAGKITADQATALKATLTTRVTTTLDSTHIKGPKVGVGLKHGKKGQSGTKTGVTSGTTTAALA